MGLYQNYLDQNGITRYKVAKASGVSNSTLQRVAESEHGTDTISGKILKATAVALDKKPWKVFEELLKLESSN
ncbi:MAG: XRE family transcriptional regulator [Lactobacillus sp.]|nr:MAG: XRE family transcriptional regulator [Lactobacillus sp.]